MKKLYFYKLEDYEDDEYSWFIATDTECKDLLEEIADNYVNEEDCEINGKIYNEENFYCYVMAVLEDNNIKVEELEFETIVW